MTQIAIPAHVERMIAEADQVGERVEKLGDFLGGETYSQLPGMDQSLLNAQMGAMTAYLAVLMLRIERAHAQ